MPDVPDPDLPGDAAHTPPVAVPPTTHDVRAESSSGADPEGTAADPAAADTASPDSAAPDPARRSHRRSGSSRFVFDGTAYVPAGSRSRGRTRPSRGSLAGRARRIIRHHRRALGTAMLVVGGLVILAAVWTGWRAYQAYSHLTAARATVADISAKVGADGLGGLDGVTRLTTTLADETAAARSAVDDPIFRIATHTPWIGENLAAVRGVATSMDGLAQAAKSGIPALAPLADRGSWASGGRFELSVIEPAATAITRLNDAVQSAKGTVTSFDRRALVGPVNGALNEYGAQLTKLSSMTTAGADAANIVLPILGADGPRTYLIAFQNLAELRATGGIFGFYAELHVKDGTLTLGAAGSSDRDLGSFDPPIPGVPDGLGQLYGTGMDTLPQNVNLRPDFPMAASTFSQMYERHSGQTVDGVIAIDPVVVATLLQGVAPIDMGRGLTLSSDTAVKVLQSSIYDVFPGGLELATRDAFTAKALGDAFKAVLGNVGHLREKDLLTDMKSLIGQRRILVWSADSSAQDAIATTPVSGQLQPDAVGKPTAGVFLDDFTGGKMDYYLRASADLGGPQCALTGADAPLHLTFTNTAPAKGLPPYVVGVGNQGKPPSIFLNVILASPTGGKISNVRLNGASVGLKVSTDGGRAVNILSFYISPGTTVTVDASITMPSVEIAADGGQVTPELMTTPMAHPFETTTTTFAGCK